MRKIYFFHITDKANIGDAVCSPMDYFEFDGFEKVRVDIRHPEIDKLGYTDEDIFIIGGGGLIMEHQRAFDFFSCIGNMPNKKIIWGVGFNPYSNCEYVPYKGWTNYDLVGIRNVKKGFRYLPCVSCMHPAFDKDYGKTTRYGVYAHKHVPVGGVDFELLDNSCMDMDVVIKFLATKDTVITTSYHGMYWSTLLEKRVITMPNRAVRFEAFKYPAAIWTESLESATKSARVYPEALKESRELNNKFYEEVMNLIT